jgi:chitinase
VVPGDPADVGLYQEFTALKSGTLQTWIAIGGWNFNDLGKLLSDRSFSSLEF